VRILVGHAGLSLSPPLVVDSTETVERTFAVPEYPRAVLDAYLGQDVSVEAGYQRHPVGPRYPDHLRAQNRGGIVRTQFVVDRDGKPDMSTFQVLASDDPSFTESVRRFISDSRFTPAQVNGAPVSQLYDQAFDFGVNLGNDPAPPRISEKHLISIRATGVIR
jgi:TonB family protein